MEEIVENLDQTTEETVEQGPDVSEITGGAGGDDTNDLIDNTEEGAEEQETDDSEFNPDDLEFDDSVEAKFGDYDLTAFKDRINFENDEVRELFNNQAAELKEQGFTQKQVEYLLNKEIEHALKSRETEAFNKEKVKAELQKSLSLQEKRDYKAVGQFLKEITQGDEQLNKVYKEAMSNPIVYKLLHRAFMKGNGGKPLGLGTTKGTKEVRSQGMTLDRAISEYTDYLAKHLGDGEDRTPIVNKLIKDLSKEQQEQFKKTFNLK